MEIVPKTQEATSWLKAWVYRRQISSKKVSKIKKSFNNFHKRPNYIVNKSYE